MSFWDTITGKSASDTANKAAEDTYRKQLEAGRGIRDAGDKYTRDVTDLYSPQVGAGRSALDMLLSGLGLGGNQEGFVKSYRGLPGYESGRETGTNAALRGIQASGMSNSGRALKALQRFGSDYEDQRVGDYLTRLTGINDRGMQAQGAVQGGMQGRLGAYTAAGQGDYGAAGTIGEGMVAGEQAKSDAWGKLLGAGTYIGGSLLGGGFSPFGKAGGTKPGSFTNPPPPAYNGTAPTKLNVSGWW